MNSETADGVRVNPHIASHSHEMDSQVKPITAEEILSEFHRKALSPAAVRLYVAVWFRMANRGATKIWLSDEDVSRRARIALKNVPATQWELARAGLLFLTPGNGKVEYLFVVDPENLDSEEPSPQT
jgi:hypothetical protein